MRACIRGRKAPPLRALCALAAGHAATLGWSQPCPPPWRRCHPHRAFALMLLSAPPYACWCNHSLAPSSNFDPSHAGEACERERERPSSREGRRRCVCRHPHAHHLPATPTSHAHHAAAWARAAVRGGHMHTHNTHMQAKAHKQACVCNHSTQRAAATSMCTITPRASLSLLIPQM